MSEAAKKRMAKKLEVLEKLEADRLARAREFEHADVVDDEDVSKTSGRMGLVSPERRQTTRKRVAEMQGGEQFATEIAPTMTGATLGGLMGAFPPLAAATGGMSIAGGAALGGIAGELVGQETGVSPQSDAGVIMSGAAIGAPGLGAAAQKLGRRLSTSIKDLPVIRTAVARRTMERAAGEFETLGTQIISARTGMVAHEADVLYKAAKHFSGAEIPVENFHRTFQNIRDIIDVYKDIPGMEAAAIRTEKAVRKALSVDTQSLGMDDVMSLYKATNDLATTAQRTPGVTNKITEDLFKMFDKDIDMIAEGGSKGGRAAVFVQAAFKRSQLDRAVQTLERGVAKFTKQSPAGDDMLDVEHFSDWLQHKTNPQHADYDKNMTENLAQDLPNLKHKLGLWVGISHGATNPGGPGSLTVRASGAAMGAQIGGTIAGPIGAAIGGIKGTRLPEDLVSILMSKKGRASMDWMLRMGKGTINQQRWAQLTNIATQAARPAVGPTIEFTQGMLEE